MLRCISSVQVTALFVVLGYLYSNIRQLLDVSLAAACINFVYLILILECILTKIHLSQISDEVKVEHCI